MVPALPDDMVPTTRTYENFLDGVEKNGLSLTQAVSTTIDLGSASLEIIPITVLSMTIPSAPI